MLTLQSLGPNEEQSSPEIPHGGYRLLIGIRSPVIVEAGEDSYSGFTSVLGLLGATLEMPNSASPPSNGELTISLDGGPLQLPCELSRSSTGLWIAHFTRVSSADRERLYHLLADQVGVPYVERGPRLPIIVPVTLEDDTRLWDAATSNLSVTGALIYSSDPLAVAHTYQLSIDLNGRVVRFQASVVRIVDDNCYGVGLHGGTVNDRAHLRDYLEAARAVLPAEDQPTSG